jgi:hypothetical protein
MMASMMRSVRCSVYWPRSVCSMLNYVYLLMIHILAFFYYFTTLSATNMPIAPIGDRK